MSLSGPRVGKAMAVVLRARSRKTGLLVDVPNATIEIEKPNGITYALLALRKAPGTYQGGDGANPILPDMPGPWKARLRSTVDTDLVDLEILRWTVGDVDFGATPTPIPAPTVMNFVRSRGQSTDMGYPGGLVLGNVPRAGLFMLKGGIVGLRQLTPFAVIDASALVPLVETHTVIDGFTSDETGGRAFADVIYGDSRFAGQALCLVCDAVQGTPLASRKKGTTIYTNGLALMTAARDLAIAAGYTIGRQLCTITADGESDASAGTYRADKLQEQADCEADAHTIFGGTATVPMIMLPQAAVVGALTADSADDCCFLAYTYPTRFVAAGARHFLTTKVSPHWDSASYRKQGALLGRAFLAYCDGNGSGSGAPLPNRTFISRVGGVFTVHYNAPLAQDTSVVLPTPTATSPLEMFGWSIWSATGSAFRQVTAVTISDGPFGPQSMVTITCAVDPGANCVLRYAMGVSGDPRGDGLPTTGPRGNLVATDRNWIDADGNALPCYAPRFQVTVA